MTAMEIAQKKKFSSMTQKQANRSARIAQNKTEYKADCYEEDFAAAGLT